MSYQVEVAESAERDIAEVADVVAFAYGDPVGASRLAGRIFDVIASLSEIPGIKRVAPILAAKLEIRISGILIFMLS